MATGPEHYSEAEVHLAHAANAEGGSDRERYMLAAAQVHATLAHAAAVVNAASIALSIKTSDAWDEVLGEVSSQ